MHPVPYLTFPGTCAEAMAFYADVFGGEITMVMKASDMPDFPVPADKADWLAHATVMFGEGTLNGSDDIMGGGAPMAGCSVMMTLPDKTAAETAFNRMAEGGEIEMPFGEMFWSAGFGTLTDRFGIKWMIDTETPAAD